MNISKNFKLHEFVDSYTAIRARISNNPPAPVIENIKIFCNDLLQPLRDHYGKPMYINSGYRCKKLNQMVGGVETSFHRKGLAADIRCQSPKDLLNSLIASGLDFDQAILYPTFLHIGYNPEKGSNRRQIIRK
jgi:hypothetical protein